MKPLFSAAVLSCAGLLAAPALAASGGDPGVRVEHAAARLVVIPEARNDVQVSIRQGDPRLPPAVARLEGGTVVVEGGLDRRIGNCGRFDTGLHFPAVRHDGAPQGVRVFVRGVGPLALERLPVITARVPLAAAVAGSGAVWGEVGPSNRLSVQASGCGDWRIGAVRESLTVANAGSGDVQAAGAGALQARLVGSGDLVVGAVAREAVVDASGSGDVRLAKVSGRLTLRVAGSGGVRAREVDGPVQAAVSGSGDVQLDGGQVPTLAVEVAGSGDFSFGGTAGSLSAAVAGSGDVSVAHVTGPVTKAVHGSGEVRVGR